MCTVLLAWRCLDDAPVVLAANRDELLLRPSAPPGVLRAEPLTAGGRDLTAGGTWLAVRADGRLCAVTNRRAAGRGETVRDPSRRSRGEIPLLVLEGGDDGEALRRLETLDPAAYNPVNVLLASPDVAAVAHADAALRIVRLRPGPHVLTVHDVDGAAPAKDAGLRAALDRAVAGARSGAALAAALEELLRDHGTPGGDPLDAPCIHAGRYGTVSSSTVIVDAAGRVTYRHAPGPPCTTAPADVSDLLRAAGSGAASID